MTRAVATGVVSIGLAAAHSGAWALAWGTLAGTFSYTVAVWLLVPERVALLPGRTSPGRLNAVLRYGIPVAGGTLLAKLIFDVDYLIVGTPTGFMRHWASTLWLSEFLSSCIIQHLLPSSPSHFRCGRARSDRSRLTEGYLLSTHAALHGVTAGVGIAVVAPLLVPLVFGEASASRGGPVDRPRHLRSLPVSGCRGERDIQGVRPTWSDHNELSLLRLGVLVPVLILAARWGLHRSRGLRR